MEIVYTLLFVTFYLALFPGISITLRDRTLYALVVLLALVAPLSVMRDVPQHIIDFQDRFGYGINEYAVRLALACIFIFHLKALRQASGGSGGVFCYFFAFFPTLGCNQIRLSFALLIYYYLRMQGFRQLSILGGAVVHQSMAFLVLIKPRYEMVGLYLARVGVILVVCIFASIYIEQILTLVLPHLGNLGVYINAKNISDIYDVKNPYEGIEFVLIISLMGAARRRLVPAIFVAALFLFSKQLTFLPSVVTGRLFELASVVVFYEYYRALPQRIWILIASFIVLIVRMKLHYSWVAEVVL